MRATAGFGVERLGLVTLRHPRWAAVIAILATLLLGFLAARLPFESSIRDIFRSDGADYALLREVVTAYPANEYDVLVVASGAIFRRDTLEKLRAFHLDATLVDGVSAVLSPFSAVYPPDAQGHIASVVPADLADVKDLDALRLALLRQPLVRDKLLSDDGTLALFVVSLAPDVGASGDLDLETVRRRTADLRLLAKEDLEGAGLELHYSGMPLIRLGIVDALKRDQEVFRIAGFLLGTILTWLFFRRLRYVVIVAVPVLAAVVWQLGSMALLGQSVNVLTAVVPTLVMVLTFSDGLHLLFAAQRAQAAGKPAHVAVEESIRAVGPAAALTSMTTMLALLTLGLTPHPFIAGFGLAGALGSVIAFLAVILLFPPLAFFVLRLSKGPVVRLDGGAVGGISAGLSAASARLALGRPATVAGLAVVATLGCGALYAANEPHYTYRENLPAGSDVLSGIAEIDARLGGSGVVHLYLTFMEGDDVLAPKSRAAIADAQAVLAADPLIHTVWSLTDVEDWYRADAAASGEMERFLSQNRDRFARRVIGADGRSALVTGYFPNVDAAVLLPALERIDRALGPVRTNHPDVGIAVTGFDAVAARASTDMIDQLSVSLVAAVAVIVVVIGLALRSWRAALVGLLPNVLPILVGGAFVYVAGFGLQFTSVIAFTISFGIAVDGTIHMFNRYRLERRKRRDVVESLRETLMTVGPVIIVSTIVLVLGLGTTVTSLLPTVRVYGIVSVLVLLAALVADLLVLPALLLLASHRRLAARKGSDDDPAAI